MGGGGRGGGGGGGGGERESEIHVQCILLCEMTFLVEEILLCVIVV